jgi:hypothetical protein
VSDPHLLLIETDTNQIIGVGDDLTNADVEPDYFVVAVTDPEYEAMLAVFDTSACYWCDGAMLLEPCP